MPKALILIVFLIPVVGCAPAIVLDHSEHLQVTGIFSDLRFVEESGDLVGTEMFIVVAENGGYAVAVQFAEGEPGLPFVARIDEPPPPPPGSIPPEELGRFPIAFTIEEPAYRGRFEGHVYIDRIEGSFHFHSNTHHNVNLPRKSSYWQ